MMLKRFSFSTTRTRRASTTTPTTSPDVAAHPPSPPQLDLASDALQTALSKKMSEIMDEKVRTSIRLHKEAITKADETESLVQQVRTLKEQLGRQSTLLLDQESVELARSRETLYKRIQAPPNFWVEQQTDCPADFFDPMLAFYAAESSRTAALQNAIKSFFDETTGQDITQTPQRTSYMARQARGNTEIAKLLSVARALSFSVVDFHDTSGFALTGGVRPSITLTFCGLVPTIQHAVGFIQWSSSVSSWSSESSASLGGLLHVMCASLEEQEMRQFIYGALVDLDSVQIYRMEKLIDGLPGAFKTTAYAQTSFRTGKKNGKNPLARMLLTDPETLGLEISLPLRTKPPPSALTWLKSFRQVRSSGGGSSSSPPPAATAAGRDTVSEEKEEEEDDNATRSHSPNRQQQQQPPTKRNVAAAEWNIIGDLDLSPPQLAPLAITKDSAFFAVAKHPEYVIKTFRTVDSSEMRREIQSLELLKGLNLPAVCESIPVLIDVGPNFLLLTSMDRMARMDASTSLHLLRGPLMALQHAHKLGIVHRCISTENLLIGHHGTKMWLANWNWSGSLSESISVELGPGLRFASDDVLLAALHVADTTFTPRDDLVSLARCAAWMTDLCRTGSGQGELPLKAGPGDVMRYWSRALISFGIAELCKAASRVQYEEMSKLLERRKMTEAR